MWTRTKSFKIMPTMHHWKIICSPWTCARWSLSDLYQTFCNQHLSLLISFKSPYTHLYTHKQAYIRKYPLRNTRTPYTRLSPCKTAYARGYTLNNTRTQISISATCKCPVENRSSTYNKVCLHQFIPLNRIQSHSHYIMCETTIAISSSSTWSKYHYLGTSA